MAIPSLTTLAGEVLDELGAVRTGSADGAITWSYRSEVYAVLGPLGIEIRLDPAIAAAATRTPDTGPSGRGPGWVRFNPREMDGHAADRLRAWLGLAHRRVGAGS